MPSPVLDRYAVYAIGEGGVIRAEYLFADLVAATEKLDAAARVCESARRVILVDRRDGRRLLERQGPAA